MNTEIPAKNKMRRNSSLALLLLLCLSMEIALSIFPTLIHFLIGTPLLFGALIFLFNRYTTYVTQSAGQTVFSRWDKKPRIARSFCVFFIILVVCSLIYWFAYYPGGFNLDAYGQWMQAHGSLHYNDWHPVVSTLLIQLCITVFDNFPFCILVQIILFSISSSLLLCSLGKQGVPFGALVFIAACIGLSPAVGLNTICMTKDVQFTILIINLTTCCIEIVFTDGKWLQSWIHCLVFIILSALTMFVRHNGVLFVAPMLLCLLLCGSTIFKRTILIACSILIIVVVVRGPVFKQMNVEPHDNVVGEAVGIPMSVMANALVNDPEHVPTEVHTFLNEIATDEEWKEAYIVGEWDSCKWSFGGVELLQGASLREILRLAIKTFTVCPNTSYDSVRENTKIVWSLFQTESYWVPEEYIAENNVGIKSASSDLMHSTGEHLKTISLFPVLCVLIWNTGFQLAVVLFILLMGRRITARNAIFVLPLLTYILGTMALLAGPNQRYFYCTAVLFLPISLAILQNSKAGAAK